MPMTRADPTAPASPPGTTPAAAGADWIDRLYARAPLPPWGVGLALALAMLALFAFLTGITGELSAFLAGDESVISHRNFRLGLILPLLAAYLATAQRYLALASRRNLLALEPMTGPEPLEPAAPRHGWVAVLAAPLIVAAIALTIDRDPTIYFYADYWTGGAAGNWVVGVLTA